MTTVSEVAQTMQVVLRDAAERVARATGFVRRKSKLTGPAFVQTLVFGWLSNPDASLDELSQTAAARGVTITPQGLDQRFTPEAADLMKQVLEAAVQHLIRSNPVAIALLERFQGVFLVDSSTVVLPDSLADTWQGNGGRSTTNTQSAVKMQVKLELCTGQLEGPELGHGRGHDGASQMQWATLPKGSLRIADLGYHSLDWFAQQDAQGIYFLSRLKTQTAILDRMGHRLQLLPWLTSLPQTTLDMPILLGAKHRLPCRLLIVRVPQEVAEQRRRRLHEQARVRGQTVSKERLALTDWTLLITNVPEELLSLREALVLARARWQIEMLFKLWKSGAHLATWRSQKPWRILCEFYAKLVGVLIQHWILLTSLWVYPNRSLAKAAKIIRKHTMVLAIGFDSHALLCQGLRVIQSCLASGCRMNTRRAKPNTYQLLMNPQLLTLA